MKIIPSLVLTSPRPTARHHRSSSGYSLMEVIVVVATLTSVTAMAVISINNTQVGGKSSKLRQDVAVLNSAVRAYLLSGGDLSNTTTGGAVIAKLKTTTDTSNSNQIAGLRGSMVDQRLSGISSSEAGVLKAVWVDSKKSFQVLLSGTGFKEFTLDPAAVPATVTTETRTSALAINSSDKWVWAFNERPSTAASPQGGATGTYTPVTTPNTSASMTVLLAPSYSLPSGLYPYNSFNPDMKVSLTNPNSTNTADTFYSIAGASWTRWDGTPLSIPRALVTEVRAYCAPLDPDLYEASATVDAKYETIYFGGNSAGVFKDPVGTANLVSNLKPPGSSGSFFNWGTPFTTGSNPNSLTFTGINFDSVAPDQLFEVGKLSYFNGTTVVGTTATSVQLSVALNLTTPGVTENLLFSFNLLSTPNTSNTGNPAVDDDANADFVYIPNVSTRFNTIIKGQTFYLKLSFGTNDLANGFTTINEFHAHENKTLTGSIFGKFTTTPPPAPPPVVP